MILSKYHLQFLYDHYLQFTIYIGLLYLFNKAVTSQTYKLSKKYTINIILDDIIRLPNFHTCFNTVDIYYNEYFVNKYLNNKNEFINLLNLAIGGGFEIE